MATTNHQFYPESVSSWNREWVDSDSDECAMTEEGEQELREKICAINDEAAEYRAQEREAVLAGWSDHLTLGAYDDESPF